MRSVLWLARALAVPAIAVALLAWWGTAALERPGAVSMASWAALLLFAGFGLSGLVPRVAVASLYGAFLLQLVRPDCRFDQEGWLPYGAAALAAIVLAARTPEPARRRFLVAVLPTGLLTGLFTNLPVLGPAIPGEDGPGVAGASGLVNGKPWAPLSTFGGAELLVGTLVWTSGAVLLIVAGWMIGSSSRARVQQWRAEAESDAARQALSEHRLRLQIVEERDRIAQDLHDITAHSLSVILAQADGAAAHAEGTSGTALTTIAGSARQALGELRGLLERMDERTDGDATHGPAEVGDLVSTVRAAGARVDLLQQGDPVPLSQAAGLAVYRIVQEALTNALRHGSAEAPIRVVLDWQDSGLALTVASPVGPGPLAEPAGRGIVGMQQRARLAGGWLTAGLDAESATFVVTAHLRRLSAVVG